MERNIGLNYSLKDTFLQFIDINEGKKKQLRLKEQCKFIYILEGDPLLSDSESTKKSSDSLLLRYWRQSAGRQSGAIVEVGGRIQLRSQQHFLTQRHDYGD
jgi:hypothetical protein